MSCGVSCRRGSGPAWLWLWHRLVATALIEPLSWELSYAVGVALKDQKERKKKKPRQEFLLWHSGLMIQLVSVEATFNPRPPQWVKDAVFLQLPCSGLDKSLAWELLYAAGAAKGKKKKRKENSIFIDPQNFAPGQNFPLFPLHSLSLLFFLEQC